MLTHKGATSSKFNLNPKLPNCSKLIFLTYCSIVAIINYVVWHSAKICTEKLQENLWNGSMSAHHMNQIIPWMRKVTNHAVTDCFDILKNHIKPF
jgi:hypothetical protein